MAPSDTSLAAPVQATSLLQHSPAPVFSLWGWPGTDLCACEGRWATLELAGAPCLGGGGAGPRFLRTIPGCSCVWGRSFCDLQGERASGAAVQEAWEAHGGFWACSRRQRMAKGRVGEASFQRRACFVSTWTPHASHERSASRCSPLLRVRRSEGDPAALQASVARRGTGRLSRPPMCAGDPPPLRPDRRRGAGGRWEGHRETPGLLSAHLSEASMSPFLFGLSDLRAELTAGMGTPGLNCRCRANQGPGRRGASLHWGPIIRFAWPL